MRLESVSPSIRPKSKQNEYFHSFGPGHRGADKMLHPGSSLTLINLIMNSSLWGP